jgi:pimeloyl-ACP methyl ester carboxylesterase
MAAVAAASNGTTSDALMAAWHALRESRWQPAGELSKPRSGSASSGPGARLAGDPRGLSCRRGRVSARQAKGYCERRPDQHAAGQVYETIAGPSEFFGTRNLMDWDVTDRLAEIDVPALITSGGHGEVPPRQAQILHAGVAGSRWVVSSTVPTSRSSRRQIARAVLAEFLAGVDQAISSTRQYGTAARASHPFDVTSVSPRASARAT